jgi:hypothetical protein
VGFVEVESGECPVVLGSMSVSLWVGWVWMNGVCLLTEKLGERNVQFEYPLELHEVFEG